MRGRVRHLPLERLESLSDDIGFRQAKLDGQLVKLKSLTGIEINLDRLGNAFPGFIMTSSHDIMIIDHGQRVKPSSPDY